MYIHPVSDTHIEFVDNKLKYNTPEGTDVVVLAGDIGVGRQGVLWALKTFEVPTVIIAGNHESYGSNWKIPKLYDTLRKLCEGTHVHFLQNETVIIDDVLFAGTTLWTDYDLYGNVPLAKIRAQEGLSDYTYIRYGDTGEMPHRFSPDKANTEHLLARSFLVETLKDRTEQKSVVVSHHAPSEKSILPMYSHDDLNPCYASRLEYFMLDLNPNIWFHGHMHNSVDYMIGDTRVIANPRGYPMKADRNPKWNSDLLIEI